MKKFPSLKNHLLIAMPSLKDPSFEQSVTLLCEHNEEGAMGIVINHPLDFSTFELLEHMAIPCSNARNINPVFAGGPVQQDRGFVIHQADKIWKSSIVLEQNVSITTSTDILHAIGRHELNDEAFIALGYAGWEAGQLEQEIMQNSWLTVPLNPQIVFATEASKRWEEAINLLGIDPHSLSDFTGHA
ncbi:YqgE/AlgH family protein [Aliikangiella sp. IMCC44653]